MSEILGSSGNAQVLDLDANGANIFTPAYAVYEQNIPVRVVLFNYVTDQTGATDLTVSISVDGTSPATVNVK